MDFKPSAANFFPQISQINADKKMNRLSAKISVICGRFLRPQISQINAETQKRLNEK
jgi:hypothetical protein